MSDIKVNGNTYTGVTSVKLMKADDSGYAEYVEGASAAEDFRDVMTSGGYKDIGDYESNANGPYVGWLENFGGGTISFPVATSATGPIKNAKFENILMPNVVSMGTAACATGAFPSASVFTGSQVTGVLDLGSLTSIANGFNTFQNCTIGTLKLGAIGILSNMFSGANITNLVWNAPATVINTTNFSTLMNAATKIANLYLPADQVSAWQALIDDGTLTKIENLYSTDEWEE